MKMTRILLLGSMIAFTSCGMFGHHKKCEGKTCDISKEKKSCKSDKQCDLKDKSCCKKGDKHGDKKEEHKH